MEERERKERERKGKAPIVFDECVPEFPVSEGDVPVLNVGSVKGRASYYKKILKYEGRGRLREHLRDVGSCIYGRIQDKDGKLQAVGKLQKTVKNVKWADEAGLPLIEKRFITRAPKAENGIHCSRSGLSTPAEVHEEGIRERVAFTAVSEEDLPSPLPGSDRRHPLTASAPYKLALLGGTKTQATTHKPTAYVSAAVAKSKRLERLTRGRRCLRCFASDHLAAACRDPVRCLVCAKIGHRANRCPSLISGAVPRERNKQNFGSDMDRMLRRRGRPHCTKAYIPYTEELLRRTEMKRNAMLVDIVQPADLGHAPQQTLADAFARRFGGYPQDFYVARSSERDFAIILPGWVSAETLIRRHLVTLEAVWLRCYGWGPHRYSRPHCSRFTAWIQLRNVPFECWTPARIASMICGFGRFIKADDIS